MKKSGILVIIAAVVLSLGLAKVFRWAYDNRISNFDLPIELYVGPRTSASEVLSIIQNSGSVRRPGSLERVFQRKNVALHLHTGHYVIKPGVTSAYVARMLNNGWQTPVNLVLSGSMKLRRTVADKIASQMMMEPDDVLSAMENTELLSKYGFTPQTVFSLIIPDTYQVYWDMSVEQLFDRLYSEYGKFWNQKRLSQAQTLGLSPLQVDVLASIVYAESNYGPELPLIAGVYLNRLNRGMPLQADPTVAFCYDYKLNRVLKKHLKVDSPYNTYKHKGLPPGPICVAPPEYIDAVLNPDYGDGNLFFCANADFSGTHSFATTSARHMANARAYQRELNRRAAARRKAAKNQ